MKGSFTSMAVLAAALAAAGLAPGAAHAQTSAQPASSAVTTPTPVDGDAAAPPTAYGWGGVWFSNHYAGGYGGVMQSLKRDGSLWEDGPVMRLDVSGGQYTYNNAPAYVGEEVGIVDADIMVGYRKFTDSGTFSGWVGPAYIEHDNPDPAAAIRGSKFGAAFLGEYQNTFNKNLEVSLQGRFATPFSTWSAAARGLYKVSGPLWLGPQATLYGNDDYKELTVGPFAKLNTSFGEVGVTGGYRHPMTSGNKDGYFASVYFAVPLR